MMKNNIEPIVDAITKEYLSNDVPWYIGYSGGKDSTVVLYSVILMIEKLKTLHKDIYVVYCDTGVEIPAVQKYVYQVISNLKRKYSEYKRLFFCIEKPQLKDSFFVKVIGEGYMPPSFMFRWCTDRLRIKPIQKLVSQNSAIILVGTRNQESKERDRILDENKISEFYFKQKNYPNSVLFAPIINLTVREVWNILLESHIETSFEIEKLKYFYSDSENNYLENQSKARFGCWICTVIRKDLAGQKLLNKGFKEMEDLMSFRQQLIDYRNNPSYRLPNRRTKIEGTGPFKLEYRKQLLNQLLEIERNINIQLITKEEIEYIGQLWNTTCSIEFKNFNLK